MRAPDQNSEANEISTTAVYRNMILIPLAYCRSAAEKKEEAAAASDMSFDIPLLVCFFVRKGCVTADVALANIDYSSAIRSKCDVWWIHFLWLTQGGENTI